LLGGETIKGRFKNITVKNAHRAEDDARVCMEIFVRRVTRPIGGA
jgi:hypothetical protein